MIKYKLNKEKFPYLIPSFELLDKFPSFELLDKYERWRKVAKVLNISHKARLRLEWIIYYDNGRHRSANSQTLRHCPEDLLSMV